jgi:hypothetical protein
MAGKSAPFPGRECGTCSLCCKLIAVKELKKPEGKWCLHCAPGKGGCQIYEQRPSSCQDFHCGWLQTDLFGDEWRPITSKMVISGETQQDGSAVDRITVYVDPGFPTAWRKEPYYSLLRRLGDQLMARERQLLVRINDRTFVFLPDKAEIDLGLCKEDDIIVTRQVPPFGEWEAVKISAESR